MNPIEALKKELEGLIPGLRATLDSPPHPLGSRWLDLSYGDRKAIVEWRPLQGGFGVSSCDREPIFGEGPDETYYDFDTTVRRLKEVLVDRVATEPIADIFLEKLRAKVGMSQVELAKALGISQPTLSKIERRPDMLLSTLRRVVEALGGHLNISAIFPAGEIQIARIQPLSSRRPVPKHPSRKRVHR